jgi:hypothetical protein
LLPVKTIIPKILCESADAFNLLGLSNNNFISVFSIASERSVGKKVTLFRQNILYTPHNDLPECLPTKRSISFVGSLTAGCYLSTVFSKGACPALTGRLQETAGNGVFPVRLWRIGGNTKKYSLTNGDICYLVCMPTERSVEF